MNNFSGFSTIIALSKQLETITALQKAANPLQLSGAMQQVARAQNQLTGALNSSGFADAVNQSAMLQKQLQNPAVINNVASSLQGVLKTVSLLTPYQTACFDAQSPVSASKIKAVAEGIQFHDDHVELTPEAKDVLDSIPDESIPDEPVPDEAEPDGSETPDAGSVPEPESPAPHDAGSARKSVILSAKDFLDKYAERLIGLANMFIMIITLVAPDSATNTILTKHIVPAVESIAEFLDDCRGQLSENFVDTFFEYWDRTLDALDRNTESNEHVAESNEHVAKSNEHLAEAYNRFADALIQGNNIDDH